MYIEYYIYIAMCTCMIATASGQIWSLYVCACMYVEV
jgi:hypothetical protein